MSDYPSLRVHLLWWLSLAGTYFLLADALLVNPHFVLTTVAGIGLAAVAVELTVSVAVQWSISSTAVNESHDWHARIRLVCNAVAAPPHQLYHGIRHSLPRAPGITNAAA